MGKPKNEWPAASSETGTACVDDDASFWAIFSKVACVKIGLEFQFWNVYGRIFLGRSFLEEFLLRGINFEEFFGRNFLRGIFWQELALRDPYYIWLFLILILSIPHNFFHF